MLVNVQQELISSFHHKLQLEYWKADSSMINYLEQRFKTEYFQPTSISGLTYSDLNPKLFVPENFNFEEYPNTITLNKPFDKRNRKFKKIIGEGYSKYWETPFEDLEKLSPQERNSLRKESKTEFYFNSYGVCDTPEQLYSHVKFLNILDEDYTVFLTPILKEEEPSHGGWRWHKWGEYIGNQKRIGAEYLYHEPHINLVYVFGIARVTKYPLIHSTDLLDFYDTGRFIVVYNKENELVSNFMHTKYKDVLVSYSQYKDRPYLVYVGGDCRDNLPIFAAELNEFYSDFLNTGNLPEFKKGIPN